MARTRLSPEKWIAAGFDALARTGPQALAAEPLARALKTTKGSFYWHFKDVPAFQGALITAWQAQALQHVVTAVQQTGDADVRLRAFGQGVLADPVEPQLRIWAQADTRAAAALREVDEERLEFISRLLSAMGLSNVNFARAIQATLTGLPLMANASDTAPFETLVDTILALE
ncbi:MAG: TetR/AcrR family transcriptional regulator [Pseudomonadota bacterium]